MSDQLNPHLFINIISKIADEAFNNTTLDECPFLFLIDKRIYHELSVAPIIGVHYMYGGDLYPDYVRVAFKPNKNIDYVQQMSFHETFNNLMGEVDESEFYN